MSDDLREQLTSAFAASEAGTLDTAPVASVSDPLPEAPAEGVKAGQTIPGEATPRPAADGRARNPDGTFAPKAGDAPAQSAFAEKPAQDAQAAPHDASKAAEAPAAQAERIAPPAHWKGAGKVRWERLPVDVQRELAQDYNRLEQTSAKVGEFERIIGPRAAQLAAEYGSPEKAVEQLFSLSDFAARQPQQFVAWFCQTRGINPASLMAQPAQQPAYDPALAPVLQPLQQQVEQLTRQLQSQQSQAEEVAQTARLQTVRQFMADPAHPYVNDVFPEMVALINAARDAGAELTLQDAYDRAAWANPAVRAQLQADQREKAEAEQRAKAEAARRAGATLTGSPLNGATPSAAHPASTVRDELLRAWNAHRA